MKIKKIAIMSVLLMISLCFSFNFAYADKNTVYLGGFTAGFKMNSKGAEIIGITDVLTEEGTKSPARDAGLMVGDIILFLNDKPINSSFDIEKAIKKQKNVEIVYERSGITNKGLISPAKDSSGGERLGIFVRDSIKGIGTVTFIKNSKFGALGHPVVNDYGEKMAITGGEMFLCNVTGIVKGERGAPGELRGGFAKNKVIGDICSNKESGVFGEMRKDFDYGKLLEVETTKGIMGDAKIYSNLSGEFKFYDISIIKVDPINKSNKNYVIKITDTDLLDLTGGIVQGMSGSPIVQDGKLVGAVTHVFVNDPTRGFGIFYDNMQIIR